MSKKDFLELFNPANAANLTTEDFQAMNELTPDEIAQLAAAYPNQRGQRNYLVLGDRSLPPNKQLNSTSSWENLNSLLKVGQKQHFALSFVSRFDRTKTQTTIPRAKTQDLSEDELQKEIGKGKSKAKAQVAETKNLGEGSNVNDNLPDLSKAYEPPKPGESQKAPIKAATKAATKSATKAASKGAKK